MRRILRRAARYLTNEAELRLWQDTRTTATAVWGLTECGLVDANPELRDHCVNLLLHANNEKVDDDGAISFNREVWDTSLALTALASMGTEDTRAIRGLQKWLTSQVTRDNVNQEPWETLWTLVALLATDTRPRAHAELYGGCLRWILECRTKDGVLIGPHYMGLLLLAIGRTLELARLPVPVAALCREAAEDAYRYLWRSYLDGARRRRLWTDEPWSIGLILSGIAAYQPAGDPFVASAAFNKALHDWFDGNWDAKGGWHDSLDTACAFVGLVHYTLRPSVDPHGRSSKELRQQFARFVNYTFHGPPGSDMRVRPIWTGRAFQTDKQLCFVLMPFTQAWSSRVFDSVRRAAKEQGLRAERADQMFDADVMEDIWKGLNRAAVIVADCTGRNPNVFYELGLAHTLGKRVIVIVQDRGDIPFDLERFRNIQYDPSARALADLRRQLGRHIGALVQRGG